MGTRLVDGKANQQLSDVSHAREFYANNVPTMTSSEMGQSLQRHTSNEIALGLIASPFKKLPSSKLSQLDSQQQVMTLDNNFSDSESTPSLRVKSNSMCELSFVFEAPNNPE